MLLPMNFDTRRVFEAEGDISDKDGTRARLIAKCTVRIGDAVADVISRQVYGVGIEVVVNRLTESYVIENNRLIYIVIESYDDDKGNNG